MVYIEGFIMFILTFIAVPWLIYLTYIAVLELGIILCKYFDWVGNRVTLLVYRYNKKKGK